LARNTLGNCLVIESNTGHIKWCYFEYLHEIQSNLSLKFANKITGVHLNWKSNKMKVKLAVQLLSSSTAKAIQYLKDNNYKQFKDSDETIVFCQRLDQLFDFLNSRNPFSKGYKSPIFKSNLKFLKSKMIPFINYLYSLKYKNKLLFTTNKKTFILGFTIGVKSMFEIAAKLFTENLNFKYILTYYFSQDHIELLFGRIRQRYGANNNPNVIQFKTAIKQILLKNAITCSTNNNCNTFDEDIISTIFPFKWNKNKNNVLPLAVAGDDNEDDKMEILNICDLLNNTNSSYEDCKKNIIYYITGYAIKKIIFILDCNSCKQSLIKPTSDHNYNHSADYSKCIGFKNNGGLIFPSESSFKVVYQTEIFLLSLTNNLQTLNIPNLDLKITSLVNTKFALDKNIFKYLECNNVFTLDRPHKLVLIALLIQKYLSIRLHSFGKMYSTDILNPISNRHKLTKQILFMNQ